VYLLLVYCYSGPRLDYRLVHFAYLVFISSIFLFRLDPACYALMRRVTPPSLKPFDCRRSVTDSSGSGEVHRGPVVTFRGYSDDQSLPSVHENNEGSQKRGN